MLNIIASVLISAVISVATVLGLQPEPQATLTPAEIKSLVKVNADQIAELKESDLGTQLAALSTFFLSGAGVSSSATDITLTSLTLPQSGQRLNASDLAESNELFYLTLEPGNRSRQEIVACSSVTHNSGGTATLGGCSRGLSPISPYTASTTLRFAHGGGTQVVFSDPPQVFNQFAAVANEAAITGEYSFLTGPVLFASSGPYFTSHPTFATDTAVIDKKYADDLAITGAPVAASSTTGVSGIVRIADGIEAASSSSFATHGTTSPHVISTYLTSSDPQNDCANASTTANYCIPITRANGLLDENWISTSAPYSWEGAHVFSFHQASSTLSDQVTLALTVDGDSLFTGTTTMGGLIATTTSIKIGGVQYEFPGNDGDNGQQLTTDGSGVLSWTSPTGGSLTSIVPNPIWGPAATSAGAFAINTNSSMDLTAFMLPQPITVNSMSFFVVSVGTAGTFDATVYSEDGQTQELTVTSGIVPTTRVGEIFTLSGVGGVTLSAGVHWIGFNSNGTTDVGIAGWTCDVTGEAPSGAILFGGISGEPRYCGTDSLSVAGTPDTTISPTGIATSSRGAIFRLDN